MVPPYLHLLTASGGREAHYNVCTDARSRRSGGIGRRDGFKIRFPQGSVGSSPTSGIRRVRKPDSGSSSMGYVIGMFLVVLALAAGLGAVFYMFSGQR